MDDDLADRNALSLEGRAFLANSSRTVPARLITRRAGEDVQVDIVSIDGALIADTLLSDLRVDPPLGSAPRRMMLRDGTMFETDDRAGVEALTGRTRGSVLHLYEQYNRNLIYIVGLLLISGYVIYRYGLDILVAAAIWLTPPVFVDQLDQGTLRTIDFTMADETKLPQEERDRVSEIFKRMSAALPEDVAQEHDLKLLFRDMPGVGPNAFALPGGTMVITDEFVKKFPQDDVLAGVIGHEIGHVVEQHGLKQTYRSLSIYILIAYLIGDPGPLLEDVLLEGNLLLSLSFSREHESSADEFGLRLADEAGYDPAGLVTFFEEIRKLVGENDGWLSTHPSNSDRIDAIEAFIGTL